MKKEKTSGKQPDKDMEQVQTEGQIRLRVDERELKTTYANAFRVNSTPDEIIADFGLNLVHRTPEGADAQAESLFRVNERIILNPYTAKRLALTLGSHIRRYEEQFGELELDVSKRRRTDG